MWIKYPNGDSSYGNYPIPNYTSSGFPGSIYSLISASDGSMLAIVVGDNRSIGELFRSTDKGTTWLPDSNGLIAVPDSNGNIDDSTNGWEGFQVMTLAPNGDIYTGNGTSIFHSTDNGVSWIKLYFNPSAKCLAVDNNGNIFAGSYEEVYVPPIREIRGRN